MAAQLASPMTPQVAPMPYAPIGTYTAITFANLPDPGTGSSRAAGGPLIDGTDGYDQIEPDWLHAPYAPWIPTLAMTLEGPNHG